jgi:hypothetical protein
MHPDDLFPDCGRVRSELPGLVYDELPPDARLALERHLDGCAACRDELTALRDTRTLLARWETPALNEDARAIARSIAAQARRAAPPSGARRARLVRWTALLSGAAAALLFVLSVLGTQVNVEAGELHLSFALPGAHTQALQRIAPSRDEVRAIAAEEVALRAASLEQSQEEIYQRCSLMTREELLRLSKAVDIALAQNQESWDARLNVLGQQARRADLETQRALTSLAAQIPVSQINNR